MEFIKNENKLENKMDYFISYLNNKEETLKRKVQYFEKALRNTDKKSFYYQSYLKNIHKLNAERESIKEMLGVVNKMTNQKVMSEEEIRKIANDIFNENIMNNLDSSIIFKYIQGLEKENQELKKQLEEKNLVDLGYCGSEPICFKYDRSINKPVLACRCDNYYYAYPTKTGWVYYRSRYLGERDKEIEDISFIDWAYAVLKAVE